VSRLRDWWRRVTEPRWCRERHAEALEAYQEALQAERAEFERYRKGAEMLTVLCSRLDRLQDALDAQGLPRAAAIEVPQEAHYAARVDFRDMADELGAPRRKLSPYAPLSLYGVEVQWRDDTTPGAVILTPAGEDRE
jgi:hypothetical protein